MPEHPALTIRQREVVAAVVQTGTVKGSVQQLGVSESAVYARVEYAMERCGCTSLYQLIHRHGAELDGVNPPTTALARTG